MVGAGLVQETDEAGRGLLGLFPGPGSSRPSKELGRVNFEDGGQFLDYLQPHVGHGPLDPAEVGPIYLGIMGQLLLRDLPLMPEAAEIRRKKLA
jgi:hypothetical protein